MSTTTDVDVATNEWVKKIHFENRVDLNLQLPAAAGESAKIEIPELPSFDTKLGIIDLPPSTTPTKEKLSNYPTSNTTKTTTTDSYLNAIVSSSSNSPSSNTTSDKTKKTSTTNTGLCTGTSDCICYKCQRQKRRARGTTPHNKTAPELTRKRSTITPSPSPPPPSTTTQPQPQVSPTVAIISKNVQQSSTPKSITTARSASLPSTSSVTTTNPGVKITTTGSTTKNNSKSNTIKKSNSVCRRKTPSVKSYDLHLPRPTYSAQDSIYRPSHQSSQSTSLNKSDSYHSSVQSASDQSSIFTTATTTSTYHPMNNNKDQDDYKISWKDDTTGDDLLGSLKTFQHIFEQQPTESVTGLSDLLEVGAHEIKKQRQEEAMYQKINQQQQMEQLQMDPPKGQTYTLKYRHGPSHRPLTLYHTMKMKDSKERMAAYGTAFNHCIRANSGLSGFIKRQSNKRGDAPKILQEYTPRQPRRPTKKSILRPIIPGKKQKTTTADDMWHKISSSENPASALPPNNPWNKDQEDDSSNGITPTDVLSAAHALLPNQSPVALHDSLSRTNINNATHKPYDHVDTPSKPIPNVYNNNNRAGSERDTSSISSMSVDGDSSSKTSKSGKLFSSFGKRSSRSRSGTISSTQSRSDSIKKASMQRVNSKGSKEQRH